MKIRPIFQDAPLVINLTAMIDVIFLLLIFWMMVARFSHESATAPMNTPESGISAQRPLLQELWTVEIPRDNPAQLIVAGKPWPVDEVPGRLRSLPALPAGVLLRADGREDGPQVQRVLGMLRQSGMERVGLAVAPREASR